MQGSMHVCTPKLTHLNTHNKCKCVFLTQEHFLTPPGALRRALCWVTIFNQLIKSNNFEIKRLWLTLMRGDGQRCSCVNRFLGGTQINKHTHTHILFRRCNVEAIVTLLPITAVVYILPNAFGHFLPVPQPIESVNNTVRPMALLAPRCSGFNWGKWIQIWARGEWKMLCCTSYCVKQLRFPLKITINPSSKLNHNHFCGLQSNLLIFFYLFFETGFHSATCFEAFIIDKM